MNDVVNLRIWAFAADTNSKMYRDLMAAARVLERQQGDIRRLTDLLLLYAKPENVQPEHRAMIEALSEASDTGLTTTANLCYDNLDNNQGIPKIMAIKPENIETIQQWGIKSISKRVVDEIMAAAPKMEPKKTSGQMIEMIWEFWKTNGVTEQVNVVEDLTALLTAAGPWNEHNPLPADARAFINTFARAARKQLQPSSQPGIAIGSKSEPKQLANGAVNDG